MFDRTDIRAAVEAGALSDDGAKRLEAFLKARNDPDRMLDPENLRFLANFNDVFLTIGIVILMVGLGFLSSISVFNVIGPRMIDPQSLSEAASVANSLKLVVILSPVPVLIGAWLLAEYFCGKRRLLLPSMALSGVIVWAAGVIALGIFAPVDQAQSYTNPWAVLVGMSYAGFAGSAIAAGAIFWRFRLPFSLFLLAASVAGLLYTLVAQTGGISEIVGGAAMLGVGLGTLICAVAFDMKDPTRSTRNADHAFWLHMAAAPQIIFGVRGLVLGYGFQEASTADATVMLAVLVAFGLISLALNRRALIVSGLITFAAALWTLVNNSGWGGLNSLMLTALLVGGAIVLLGGGWRTARRFILKLFPQQGTLGRIFPPEPA
ncbi:MAG: hypothetical protein Q8R82_16270 [Hyphomonadaceae bacterium]|nr:hypothetical protein [Hyphomonadaceae bacterium]